MGLAVSMIACDAHMEDVEERAMATAQNPPTPHWWYRYMDNTNTKLDSSHTQAFTDHVNSLDSDI